MHLTEIMVLAQAAAPAAAPTGTPGAPSSPQSLFGSPLILFGLMIVMLYFMMIRPQQQRAKQQKKLLEALKSGDRVVTASGIVGSVITVKDRTVSIRSADAKMEVTKASVTEILQGSEATES
jgi:preprotein translocase subunit YajC